MWYKSTNQKIGIRTAYESWIINTVSSSLTDEYLKFDPQTITEQSPQWNESLSITSMPLIWGGYQGDFSLRNTWPRGLCLVRFPHPWGKFSTLFQQFYNLPGWPGVLPQGQADDMCINTLDDVCHVSLLEIENLKPIVVNCMKQLYIQL